MERQQDHVNHGLDDRGQPAEGEQARDGVHHAEGRHMEEDLTHAFGCNHHGANIGRRYGLDQLDVVIPAFGGAYQKRMAMPSSSPSEFTRSTRLCAMRKPSRTRRKRCSTSAP